MKSVLAVVTVAAAGVLAFVSAAPQPFDAAFKATMPSYYAALLASARGDTDGTTRQLLLLGARVKELAARSDLPAWAADKAGAHTVVATVAARVETARQQVLSRNMPAAHASLERIRYVLREARARHGVRTFDDAVTDYHEAMERLTASVGLHNEILLGPEDYTGIQEQATRAARAWKDIETRAAADPSLAVLRSINTRTSGLLAKLQQAVLARDAELAQTTAEALKNSYYELIGMLARAS